MNYSYCWWALKCRTAIKALLLNFNLCRSVMLDSLSCSFTSISFLINITYRWYIIINKISLIWLVINLCLTPIFFFRFLDNSPVCSGVCVTRSLALYVFFVDCCLSFWICSFGHGVVCSSSIYGLWLPLWYLQTRIPTNNQEIWIEGWDPINQFNFATFLCLSQVMAWISNVICRSLFYVLWLRL